VVSERTVSMAEVQRHDGEGGRRMYIACGGIVYDVTDCPKWRTGMHEQLHFPGQDLTSELPDAPHASEVFDRPCVRRVGRLDSPPS
jgi:predicted heme/steroid binding protein